RAPRAVAASLDQLYVIPPGALAYVTCGDDDARAYVGRPPAALSGARVLFLNQREALGLTGEATAEDAAGRLGELAETVVVPPAASPLRRSPESPRSDPRGRGAHPQAQASPAVADGRAGRLRGFDGVATGGTTRDRGRCGRGSRGSRRRCRARRAAVVNRRSI